MNYEIRFTPDAKNDLRGIFEYIAYDLQSVQNASDSFGETDRRTQNWQIQMNNAEAALNDMERELNDNNADLEEANANYGRAEDALEDMDREMDDVTDNADDMGNELNEARDCFHNVKSFSFIKQLFIFLFLS